MKKVLFILIAVIILAIASLYVFIPGKITVNRSVSIPANGNALLRKLQRIETWNKWWPGKKETTDIAASFLLNGNTFTPGPPKVTSVPVTIDATTFKASSELTVISHKPDSSTIIIETVIPISLNPFKRVSAYFKTKKLENDFSLILQSLHDTYSKTVNLYDYDIQKQKVVDSILVSTFEEVKGSPSIVKIYELIDQLKSYVKKNGASETGFPMLNIYTNDKVNYIVKVAIPVNKKLPDTEKIRYKWMLGGGNILITEVKGGQSEINKAYDQIINYVSDYGRIAPAISFESLVTDRRNEPDSSKWITRIYYPVM